MSDIDDLRRFVKRQCLQGRTDIQVLAIAFATARWKTSRDQIKDILQSDGAKWRRRGNASD